MALARLISSLYRHSSILTGLTEPNSTSIRTEPQWQLSFTYFLCPGKTCHSNPILGSELLPLPARLLLLFVLSKEIADLSEPFPSQKTRRQQSRVAQYRGIQIGRLLQSGIKVVGFDPPRCQWLQASPFGLTLCLPMAHDFDTFAEKQFDSNRTVCQEIRNRYGACDPPLPAQLPIW